MEPALRREKKLSVVGLTLAIEQDTVSESDPSVTSAEAGRLIITGFWPKKKNKTKWNDLFFRIYRCLNLKLFAHKLNKSARQFEFRDLLFDQQQTKQMFRYDIIKTFDHNTHSSSVSRQWIYHFTWTFIHKKSFVITFN